MRRGSRFAWCVALLFGAACQPAAAPKASSSSTAAAAPTQANASPPSSPSPKASAGPRAPSDTTFFLLYKFMNVVGAERDTFIPSDDGRIEAKAAFAFDDRTTFVPLAASYVLEADGTPRRYEAWGGTARSVTIDDRV